MVIRRSTPSRRPSTPSALASTWTCNTGRRRTWTATAWLSHPSTYEPHLNPRGFSVDIDNPYFPLPVGRTWVYRGMKDGKSQIDRVRVTPRIKVVAEGLRARVVSDVATHRGRLLEKT